MLWLLNICARYSVRSTGRNVPFPNQVRTLSVTISIDVSTEALTGLSNSCEALNMHKGF